MDINYLLQRYSVSLLMAENAACDCARLAHRGLADGYAAKIASARRTPVTGRHAGVIERAFELAAGSTNVEEIRSKLKREGYSSVDAHLAGRTIRSDLIKIIRRAA